jgi:predicted dienelactone hydrolase
MRRFICALLVAWMVIFASPYGLRAYAFHGGFIKMTLIDPVEGGPMPAIVVYPSATGAETTRLGLFTISAGHEAPPAPGAHPLIVFSHGTGGSSLGHHDSLTALASAGFVAAAVEHPRDNYRDDSGFATDLQLIGRPHHIVALIDALLAHSTIGAIVDGGRVGMVGHSAGAYTALLIAGAVPNFALVKAYREAVPSDPYRKRADEAGTQRRKPDLKYVADPRVRAIFVMAPALGYAFDQSALSKVRIPVRLYRPAADEMLPHPWNAERIAQFLPVRPEYVVLDGAGHFVFLAPCPRVLAWIARQICTDPAGIDRTALHERLNTEMVAFFKQSLGPR